MHYLTSSVLLSLSLLSPLAAETLPALNTAPESAVALWQGYDPRAESLDVEILHEWEEDGVILQVLRYRVGIFKGQKAMVAAVYGYPKGASGLPGLLQIHGGGQYADYNAVLTNAKRGYATLSLAWAGRINGKDYLVNPDVVRLFFAGDTENPQYRLTTDWGALEGYHAPSRFKSANVHNIKPADWTIDSFESPRNSTWYLWTMAARRGLTFLEQQAQVDPERLGVYGHSMGGKLTVLTAGSDDRVKAAAPSCGGISHRNLSSELYNATIGDPAYLQQIDCPTFFLSPSNDFHGVLHHIPFAIDEIQTDVWRVNSAPHHNHQDTAPYEVATQLWMDQHLKGGAALPESPELLLNLDSASGQPVVTVTADTSRPIAEVNVFYTQQGQDPELKSDRDHTIHRYWQHAQVTARDGKWTAELPLFSTDASLWVYANVTYALEEPIVGAGYYYGEYTADEFVLSTPVQIAAAVVLEEAGVHANLKPTTVIEDFEGDWHKAWFSYRNPDGWQRTTNKVYHPMYAAPESAQLALEVRSAEPNTLVVTMNGAAAEVPLVGGSDWQQIVLSPDDFKTAEGAWATDWSGAKSLELTNFATVRAKENGGQNANFGSQKWQGPAPEFRKLYWTLAADGH